MSLPSTVSGDIKSENMSDVYAFTVTSLTASVHQGVLFAEGCAAAAAAGCIISVKHR